LPAIWDGDGGRSYSTSDAEPVLKDLGNGSFEFTFHLPEQKPKEEDYVVAFFVHGSNAVHNDYSFTEELMNKLDLTVIPDRISKADGQPEIEAIKMVILPPPKKPLK